MRIVHIEDFFHPDAGYQVNILSKYMSMLGHEIYIVTSEMEKMPSYLTDFFGKNEILERDKTFYEDTGVRIIRVPLLGYFSGRSIYNKSIFKIVDSLKPDVLFVHGNDTLIGIQYILKLGKLKYPVIMDSHMLEMASINRFSKIFRLAYKIIMTPKIIKYKLQVIRTQNDSYVNNSLGVPREQAPYISVGSDVMLFRQDINEKEKFRKDNNISINEFIIVYIGKLDEAKGGKILANAFEKKFTNSKNKEVVLVVVGNTSGDYGREIENILSKSENRILRYPTQKYINLPKFYQIGDCAIFPKQCSLSFFDAQASALPVIAENNNINLDRLSYGNGLCFEEGNVDSFREKILNLIEMEDSKLKYMGQSAYEFVTDNYNYLDIAKRYLEIIENVSIDRNKDMIIKEEVS